MINFTYDDINRVLTENYAGASGTEVTYEYDTCTNGIGHLCESENAAVTSEYDYDKLGQLVTEDRTIGSNGYTTTYTYDRQGNQLIITNPDNSQVKYLYDAGGLVNEIEHKESTGSFADIISSITYNPVGLIEVIQYGNGSTTTNTYYADELYRLRTKVTDADSTNIQDLEYTYDSVGNITQIIDESETDTAKTTDYSYDDLHRLITANIEEATTPELEEQDEEAEAESPPGFIYDAIGNMINNPERGEYQYDGDEGSSYANPHAVTTTDDGHEYLYDHNGNVLDDDTNEYAWDYNNRLLEVDNGTDTFTYSYDVTGQRVKAETPSDTLYYPTKFFTDTDGDNEKHIFLGDTAIASIQGTNSNADVYTIHADYLTGSNVLTDSGEEISQLIDYYAFGALRLDDQISSYKERRKFTGHEFDSETGLTYMEARYYDPNLGRFLSQDPVFMEIFDKDKVETKSELSYNEYLSIPQVLNGYSYVINNPLRYIDQKGESFTDICNDLSYSSVQVSNFLSSAAIYNKQQGNIVNYTSGFILQAGADLFSDASKIYSPDEGLGSKAMAVGLVGLEVGTGGGKSRIAKELLAEMRPGRVTQVVKDLNLETRAIKEVKDIAGFTREGINQIISRGISPTAIKDTIVNPVKVQQRIDQFGRESIRYIGNQAVLNFNRAKKFITGWTNK